MKFILITVILVLILIVFAVWYFAVDSEGNKMVAIAADAVLIIICVAGIGFSWSARAEYIEANTVEEEPVQPEGLMLPDVIDLNDDEPLLDAVSDNSISENEIEEKQEGVSEEDPLGLFGDPTDGEGSEGDSSDDGANQADSDSSATADTQETSGGSSEALPKIDIE